MLSDISRSFRHDDFRAREEEMMAIRIYSLLAALISLAFGASRAMIAVAPLVSLLGRVSLIDD